MCSAIQQHLRNKKGKEISSNVSNTSVSIYDGLFDNDDGEGTLPGISICFNLDEQRVVSTENRRCIVTSSWCQSSFSSCCSLCRPPDVSEDGGDDTNLHGLSDSATYLSRPNVCNDSNELIPLFITSVDEMTCTPTVTACFCSKQYPMPGRGEDIYRLPIKSILIPRSCLIQILCPPIIALTTYHQALLTMMHCA